MYTLQGCITYGIQSSEVACVLRSDSITEIFYESISHGGKNSGRTLISLITSMGTGVQVIVRMLYAYISSTGIEKIKIPYVRYSTHERRYSVSKVRCGRAQQEILNNVRNVS
jgi:hypothetical protein